MEFQDAFVDMRDGKKLRRAGWNGKGMWVTAQYPDAGSQNTRP